MPSELNQFQCARHSSLRLGRGDAAHAQSETDVAPHRHVRKQRIVLEYHAETALLRGQDVDAQLIQPDAAARERQQSGNAIQRSGLAAARRAEQRDELAPGHGDGELAQR